MTDDTTRAVFGRAGCEMPEDLVLTTEERRRLVSYFLAMPSAVRPTAAAIADMCGVHEDTIERDMKRDDVRLTAQSHGRVGVAAVLVAAQPLAALAIARAAMDGDVPAIKEMRQWMQGMGVFSPSSQDEEMVAAAARAGADVLTSGDARAALHALTVVDVGTSPAPTHPSDDDADRPALTPPSE